MFFFPPCSFAFLLPSCCKLKQRLADPQRAHDDAEDAGANGSFHAAQNLSTTQNLTTVDLDQSWAELSSDRQKFEETKEYLRNVLYKYMIGTQTDVCRQATNKPKKKKRILLSSA